MDSDVFGWLGGCWGFRSRLGRWGIDGVDMAVRLFTDGSSDPCSKVGFGAMLILAVKDSRSLDELKAGVQTCRFHPTSSSRLELETLLWALDSLGGEKGEVLVYTDSQTIVGLPERRERLEANAFCSRGGRALKNGELYRKFYDAMDEYDCAFVKVQGHGRSEGKSREERVFSLVDRASREALRASLGER
ncbi:hypothetical protein VDG1235_1906 [Verrucomicrobiia bacterium DG1235]|nr:hypothetical protein VDG1235_1906 [Verrucomicrobiae bacterium DG1235]